MGGLSGGGVNNKGNITKAPPSKEKRMSPEKFRNHMADVASKKLALVESALTKSKDKINESEDEDMKFLKSLYSSFLNLAPNLKLACKRELLGVLLDYTNKTSTWHREQVARDVPPTELSATSKATSPRHLDDHNFAESSRRDNSGRRLDIIRSRSPSPLPVRPRKGSVRDTKSRSLSVSPVKKMKRRTKVFTLCSSSSSSSYSSDTKSEEEIIERGYSPVLSPPRKKAHRPSSSSLKSPETPRHRSSASRSEQNITRKKIYSRSPTPFSPSKSPTRKQPHRRSPLESQEHFKQNRYSASKPERNISPRKRYSRSKTRSPTSSQAPLYRSPPLLHLTAHFSPPRSSEESCS